jgi:hypothetical protein
MAEVEAAAAAAASQSPAAQVLQNKCSSKLKHCMHWSVPSKQA